MCKTSCAISISISSRVCEAEKLIAKVFKRDPIVAFIARTDYSALTAHSIYCPEHLPLCLIASQIIKQ